MRLVLFSSLALGLLLAGCGSDTPPAPNGKKDARVDGGDKDMTQPPGDGAPPDGENGDGPLLSDAALADRTTTGDAVGDGEVLTDAELADQTTTTDAPLSDAALADLTPTTDAPLSDAALADQSTTVDAAGDAPLGDAALADQTATLDTTVMGDAAAADYNAMDQGMVLDTIGVNDIIVSEAGVIYGTTACTDGIDNDGDGKIDADDPECTGPLDNDEATFGTGIPGDNKDCKQDCFFDGNSGGGGGDCVWQTGCDPLDTSGCRDYWSQPGGLPCNDSTNPCTSKEYCKDGYCLSKKDCPDQQTTGCLTNCKARTPNGCDCFGCCTFFLADGTTVSVKLTATCTAEFLTDPNKCIPCTPTDSCDNPCGECELCMGKTTLPASCYPDSGVPVGDCPTGWQWCGGGQACPPGTWCLTGCCAPAD